MPPQSSSPPEKTITQRKYILNIWRDAFRSRRNILEETYRDVLVLAGIDSGGKQFDDLREDVFSQVYNLPSDLDRQKYDRIHVVGMRIHFLWRLFCASLLPSSITVYVIYAYIWKEHLGIWNNLILALFAAYICGWLSFTLLGLCLYNFTYRPLSRLLVWLLDLPRWEKCLVQKTDVSNETHGE